MAAPVAHRSLAAMLTIVTFSVTVCYIDPGSSRWPHGSEWLPAPGLRPESSVSLSDTKCEKFGIAQRDQDLWIWHR